MAADPQLTLPTEPQSRPFAPVLGSAFRCIVADPPWKVHMGGPNGATRTKRGIVKPGKWNDPAQASSEIDPLQYPTMTIDEICALPVVEVVADKAHLYLWTINRYIESSYRVARAWGFVPATMLYWLKQPMGLGLGGAFVSCVEPILFARRGKLNPLRRWDRNWWAWKRAGHSTKPEELQTIAEQVSPGPYLELFARRKRPGWAAWGNEIACDVQLPNDKLRHGGENL